MPFGLKRRRTIQLKPMNIITSESDVLLPSNALGLEVTRETDEDVDGNEIPFSVVTVTFLTESEATAYSETLDTSAKFIVVEDCDDPAYWHLFDELSDDCTHTCSFTVYDRDCDIQPDYDAEFEQYMESRMSCYGF